MQLTNKNSFALPTKPISPFSVFSLSLISQESRQGMDCVSPILDVVTRVWDCTAKHAGYIKNLQENMESLRYAMEELKNTHDDVKERVERDEQRLMK